MLAGVEASILGRGPSLDLLERVVSRFLAGDSVCSVAAVFKVSVSGGATLPCNEERGTERAVRVFFLRAMLMVDQRPCANAARVSVEVER